MLSIKRWICALTVLTFVPLAFAAPARARADTVVANWQMDDPASSTVLTDSSGNGLNGEISPDAAAQGLTSNGAFLHWSDRCPACLPVQPARIVQIPDDASLDIPDPTATYTLEFRFRTTHPYGNYMQKGQSTSKGGQIKVQGPGGTVQCLFKGADGTRVGTGSPTALDDGQWHTVQCIHTETQVKEFVDGVRVAVKNGSTGPIDNKQSFTIGGKDNCDQQTITCDYFSGDIDYVTVTTSGSVINKPPVAKFTSSCTGKSCSFDASGSSDPDGTIASYDWDFGDGGTSTVVAPDHQYPAPDSYQVTLTVTDAHGAMDSVVHTVTITPTPPGPPLNAAATAADGAATVTWDAPTSVGDFPITHYTVTSDPGSHTCTTASLTCTVTGLTNGRPYTFTVIATSDAGSGPASAPSNSVHPAGMPGRVHGAKATSHPTGVRVTWTAAAANGAKIRSYQIVASTGAQRTVRGSLHAVTFGKLRPGSHVRFRVRASNHVGTGPWSAWTKRVTVR